MSTGFTGTEWNHTHLLPSSPPHLLTSSHYDLCLIVLLAELSGTTPLTFAEKTVEIAQCVEAAVPANFTDAVVGVEQETCCMSETDVDNIF